MLNDIIDGISIALDAEFPDYQIYIDDIEQGMKTPCFLIVNLLNRETQKLDNRYLREHSFNVHYFPENITNPRREVTTVGMQLFDVLEYITVNGSLVRGTSRRHEIVNDVLHFFVDYNVYIHKLKDPAPYMETLEHIQQVKGG
ncbi:MAG: phage tail terminator family protein [Sporomusa sp.]